MKKRTILATTYAVNPYRGSEDGMGWNFVIQIARFNHVIAITRENNRVHIEKYMKENPNDNYANIEFLYFDLPKWQRFWKRGGRGAMLYYWLWQQKVVNFVKQQDIIYDIVHNINFHNDWTPSYLWKLDKPFVWGPIGHHPLIPSQYLQNYSSKYGLKDKITWKIKNYFWNRSKSLKRTVKNADHIFSMNNSVADVLDLGQKNNQVMPSVATEDFGFTPKTITSKFTLISAGRLLPLKGFDLSILAFASFLQQLNEIDRQHCELIIVGSGPELEQYKTLCQDHEIENNVQFISWIERKDLMKLYEKSTAFLFPSHEGAGMVVAEALSLGLPVICLDNAGPGEFIDTSCGFAIPIQAYNDTILGLKDAIHKLYSDIDLRQTMSLNARAKFINSFHWDRRGETLKEVYSNLHPTEEKNVINIRQTQN